MGTRHPDLAELADSILVVVDCQTRLWKVLSNRASLESSLPILLEGAGLLEVPLLLTEHNPQGLGPTTAPIKRAAVGASLIKKLSFSCFGEPQFVEAVQELDRGTLVLAGVETHICILQTALDALAEGYKVHVVADGCGTRLAQNHPLALARLARAGASVTSVESVLFEWMERFGGEACREVLELLK